MGYNETANQPTNNEGGLRARTKQEKVRMKNKTELIRELKKGGKQTIGDIGKRLGMRSDEDGKWKSASFEEIWGHDKETGVFFQSESKANLRSVDVVEAILENYNDHNQTFTETLESQLQEYLPRAVLNHFEDAGETSLGELTKNVTDAKKELEKARTKEAKVEAEEACTVAEESKAEALLQFQHSIDIEAFKVSIEEWLHDVINRPPKNHETQEELRTRTDANKELYQNLHGTVEDSIAKLYGVVYET